MPHEDGTMHTTDSEFDYLLSIGLPVTDTNIEQLRVFTLALLTFHARDPKYGSLWQQYPPETMLTHMQSKLARSQANTDPNDLDDVVDLLNYTAFFYRLKRAIFWTR